MKKSFIIVMAALAMTFASCGSRTEKAAGVDSAQTEAVADSAAAALSEENQKTVDALTAELENDLKAGDNSKIISSLANMQTIYKNLVEAGKIEEAAAYGSAIKNFINSNAESLKGVVSGNATIASLVSGIQNLPTSAETTAEAAKSAVASEVVSLASPAIQKGTTLVESAQAAAEAVKNAPASVKAAAENAATTAVSSAKTAAKTAADNAVNNAKTAASNAVTSAETKASNAVNEAKTKAANKVNEAQAKAANKVNAAQTKAANKVTDAQNKANAAVNNAASKALKGLGL